MATTSNKPALLVELNELVRAHFPEYADNPGLMSAAMVGVLGAMIADSDLQRAIDLWSKIGKDKNE